MLHVEMRMHHGAAGLEKPEGLAQIIAQLGLEQMRQKRVGEHEIERPVGDRDAIRRRRRAVLIIGHAGMARMMKAETLRIVILLAPGDRFAVDVDADIGAGKAPAAEIVVAHPVRPAPATDADVEDVRLQVHDAFAQREHPEVARVHQEMGLVVEDAIADADANPQVIGRQRPKFREDEPRHHVAGVHRRAEQRIEGQFRGRREQLAQQPVEADAAR